MAFTATFLHQQGMNSQHRPQPPIGRPSKPPPPTSKPPPPRSRPPPPPGGPRPPVPSSSKQSNTNGGSSSVPATAVGGGTKRPAPNPPQNVPRKHPTGACRRRVSLRAPSVMRDVTAFQKKHQVGEGTYGYVSTFKAETRHQRDAAGLLTPL